jgi:hypothetical protein
MRDNIRSEILENISMSMLLVPFIAMRYAGDYHVAAFVFGIAFFVVYAAVIYGYAGGRHGHFSLQNYGSNIATSGYRLVDMCIDAGRLGRFFLVVYILRFMIRTGFAVYVTALILSEKNTVTFWLAAVSFVLICMYGAKGSFTKRRVLGNLLIYWMLIPLILLGVFSISRMDYGNVAREFGGITEYIDVSVLQRNGGAMSAKNFEDVDVFGTAWKIVAVMSSLELVLFSFARTGKNERRQGADLIRVAAWLIVSVLLAYVYTVGMLGSGYVKSSLRVSFGEKIDYVLALSWLIGAFYVISSYVFYAKEMLLVFADDEIYVKECKVGAGGEQRGRSWIGIEGQVTYFRFLMYGLIFTGTLFFVCCFHYDVVRPFLINALLYVDVPLSLIMPFILICIVRKKSSQHSGR